MASLWSGYVDAVKSLFTNPLTTARTGGQTREFLKQVIPYDWRYAVTQGQGIRRAFTAENERQTSAKYSSPIYGPYGSGQAPIAPTPEQAAQNQPIDPFTQGQVSGAFGQGTGGSGSDAAAAAQKLQELLAAKGRYQERFGKAQEMRDTTKRFEEDQYNTLVSRAGEKRGELQDIYGETRKQAGEQTEATKRGLTSAYGSRGLGDSSFAEKAQAETELAFQRGLTALNREEANQIREIDNYLTDIKKQREFRMEELNYQDFETVADYNDAIAKLDSDIKSIEDYQSNLRASVASATSGMGKLNANLESYTDFTNTINSIYQAAMPTAQKKEFLKNVAINMGRKDPDRDADYLYDYAEAINDIANSQDPDKTAQDQNAYLQEHYGIAPF